MKIFLSWSKNQSQQLANIFYEWLPNVLQYTETYMSSNDIALGDRWSSSIKDNLEESIFGLIFVTPENIDSPWLNFEAGALSKTIDSKVVPILYKSKFVLLNDGPLKQFQSQKNLERDSVYGLIKSINLSSNADKLSEGRLESTFDMWWPQLEKAIEGITDEIKGKKKSLEEPSEKELLNGIFEKLTEQERQLNISNNDKIRNRNAIHVPGELISDLTHSLRLLERCEAELKGGPYSAEFFDELSEGLASFAGAIGYLKRSHHRGSKIVPTKNFNLENE